MEWYPKNEMNEGIAASNHARAMHPSDMPNSCLSRLCPLSGAHLEPLCRADHKIPVRIGKVNPAPVLFCLFICIDEADGVRRTPVFGPGIALGLLI